MKVLACNHSVAALKQVGKNQYVCSTCTLADEVNRQNLVIHKLHAREIGMAGLRVVAPAKETAPNVCPRMGDCECYITKWNCQECQHRSYKHCLCQHGDQASRKLVPGDFAIIHTVGVARWIVVDNLKYVRGQGEVVLFKARDRKSCVAWIDKKAPVYDGPRGEYRPRAKKEWKLVGGFVEMVG